MKKAILLLHGFLSDMDDFDSINVELNKRYDRVYRPIFPGHGYETTCDYNNFNKDDTFSILLNSYDELKKEYDVIDVMGFSMGGALATYLSSVRSINKLILVAPANKYFNPKAFLTTTKFAFKNFITLEKSILMKDEKSKEPYNELLRSLTGDTKSSASFVMRKFIRTYIWKAYNEFKKIVIECNKDLKEIKQPTLILWGKLDQLVPKKSVDELYSFCTNEKSKLIIYEEYTHLMLMSDNPNKLIEDILLFLDRD